MTKEQSKISQLENFKGRDKFSVLRWHERGLNPSAGDISTKLTLLFNDTADSLLSAVHNNASDSQLEEVLKDELSHFCKTDYDTEEKEFVCDLFFELSRILNIDFADSLTLWLYGTSIDKLLKEQAATIEKKPAGNIAHACPACRKALSTVIWRKEDGHPESNWLIIQCTTCKEYFLLTLGSNLKQIEPIGYALKKQLPMKSYNEEQARERLEEIKLGPAARRLEISILMEWDSQCGIHSHEMDLFSEGLEEYFIRRFYGTSVTKMLILFVCRSLELKQRKLYKREKNHFEFDIVFNYDQLRRLDKDGRKALISRQTIEITSATLAKYKFKDFDKAAFLADWKKAVESIVW